MTTLSTLKHRKAVLRWIPAFCFAIAIFLFSATRGDEILKSYQGLETTIQTIAPTTTPSPASAPEITVSTPGKIDWLKAGHGIGYFCLGVSVLYALSFYSRWSPSIALLLCCLYSITDEIHQMFIPRRSASVRDVLLDTLAALIGIAILLGLTATKEFFSQKRAPAD